LDTQSKTKIGDIMHYNDIVKNGGTLGVLERDGDEYVVVESHRVTGCGSKFDGRMSYTLRRVSDGKLFGMVGFSAHQEGAAQRQAFREDLSYLDSAPTSLGQGIGRSDHLAAEVLRHIKIGDNRK
jgi:hypothetical protein